MRLKSVQLLFLFSFLVRFAVSQNDTSRINALIADAWKTKNTNLDTAILLSSQVVQQLNKFPSDKTFAHKWKERAYSKIYYYLGIFYTHTGDVKLPPEYFTKALRIATDINDNYRKSLSNTGFGLYYMRLGNFTKAQEHFFKSLQLDEKDGSKERLSTVFGNLGSAYMGQRKFEKARNYYEKALAFSKELRKKNSIAIHLSDIGNTFFEQGNSSKALELYREGLSIVEGSENKVTISMLLNNIGNIYQEQKNYQQSLDFFMRSLKIDEELNNVEDMNAAMGNIGSVYAKIKEFDKAQNYLLRALKISKEIKSLDAVMDFENSLSEMYAAWGKDKAALEHYKKYIEARDSILNEKNTEKAVRTELNYEFDKKQVIEKERHEKEIIAFEAQSKLQKQLRLFLIVFIVLILITLFFVKRAYDNEKRIASFLESESERKEILLQEVHHRINNNLQIISSLLSLQASTAKDERLNEYLTQSQNRIQSLASMHELLYQSDAPLEINMRAYLEKVLAFHREILKTKSGNVELSTDVALVNFPSKLAVPVALIVNELVTNSIKYAFDVIDRGEIQISLQPEKEKSDRWILQVKDNGKGLPAQSGQREGSLGLRLVTIMSTQLNAVYTKSNSPGASFIIEFSLTA